MKKSILETERQIEKVDNLTKEKSYILSQSILQSINDLNRQYNQLARESIVNTKSVQKIERKRA